MNNMVNFDFLILFLDYYKAYYIYSWLSCSISDILIGDGWVYVNVIVCVYVYM